MRLLNFQSRALKAPTDARRRLMPMKGWHVFVSIVMWQLQSNYWDAGEHDSVAFN
jgi:hypothetical protein